MVAPPLEAQALVPIADPSEMGLAHPAMITRLSAIPGYRPYFSEAYGSETITIERVAGALADYVRTRMSGNATYDRWATNATRARCRFRPRTASTSFRSEAVARRATPGSISPMASFTTWVLAGTRAHRRLPTKDAPRSPKRRATVARSRLLAFAMSKSTLLTCTMALSPRFAMWWSSITAAGVRNPWQSGRIVPLGLTPQEVEALVAFLRTLSGEGYLDQRPLYFPQ